MSPSSRNRGIYVVIIVCIHVHKYAKGEVFLFIWRVVSFGERYVTSNIVRSVVSLRNSLVTQREVLLNGLRILLYLRSKQFSGFGESMVIFLPFNVNLNFPFVTEYVIIL